MEETLDRYLIVRPEDVDTSNGNFNLSVPGNSFLTIQNRYCNYLKVAETVPLLFQGIASGDIIILPKSTVTKLRDLTTSLRSTLVAGSDAQLKTGEKLWHRIWSEDKRYPETWKLPKPGHKRNLYIRSVANLLTSFTTLTLRCSLDAFIINYIEYQEALVAQQPKEVKATLTAQNSVVFYLKKEEPPKVDPRRTVIGKDIGGLSDQGFLYFKELNLLKMLWGKTKIAQERQKMNNELKELFGAVSNSDFKGWVTSIDKSLKYLLQINPLPPNAPVSYLKFTADSSPVMKKTHLLLFAMIPTWNQSQNPHSTMPLGIAQGKETPELMEAISNIFGSEMERVFQENPTIKPVWCADYVATQTFDPELEWPTRSELEKGQEAIMELKQEFSEKSLTELVSMLDNRYEKVKQCFCPLCGAVALSAMDFNTWKQVTDFKEVKIGNVSLPIIYCTLHARLRITEKLLKQILFECPTTTVFNSVVDMIKILWPSFGASKTQTYVEIHGLTTMDSCRKILGNASLLDEILRLLQESWISHGAPATDAKLRAEKIKMVWFFWAIIFAQPSKVTAEQLSDFEDILSLFASVYSELWGLDGTPYIHMVVSHTATLIRKFGCLGQFEQQGLEGAMGLHKFSALRATSRKGGKNLSTPFLFCYQILMRFLRITYYGRKFGSSYFKSVIHKRGTDEKNQEKRKNELRKLSSIIEDQKRKVEEAQTAKDRNEVLGNLFSSLQDQVTQMFGEDNEETAQEDDQEEGDGDEEEEEGVLELPPSKRQKEEAEENLTEMELGSRIQYFNGMNEWEWGLYQ